MDPRSYQIVVLKLLLVSGLFFIDIGLQKQTVLWCALFCQLTQYLLCKWVKKDYSPLSPLITSLSLGLLLRLPEAWMGGVVGMVAIGSKFLIRFGKEEQKGHIFNPAMLGIVFGLFFFNGWTSSGQWGNALVYFFVALLIGGIVTFRAQRFDTALMFLFFYSLLLLVRVMYLGDPIEIFYHQLISGSFLLFSFFMITDPMTTPLSLKGRVVFVFLVAVLAFLLRFGFYMNNFLFFSLFIVSFLTPILNKLLGASRFKWQPDN